MGSLRVLLFNARSLRNKFLEFQALVATENPHLVAISETWIKSSTRDFEAEFEIEGYQLFCKDREGKEGGGVLLYVKKDIQSIECSILSTHELLGVDLDMGATKYRVLVIYRPPSQSSERDIDLYRQLGDLIDGRPSLVLGDFNSHIDWEAMDPTRESQPLMDFVNDNFLM